MRRLLVLSVLIACSDYNIRPETENVRPPAEVDDDGGRDGTVDDTGEEQVADEPIADAGPDQVVKPLDEVQLDGRASRDPNGLHPLEFKWTLVSKPQDSTSVLLDKTRSTPRFWADVAGDYVFELTVMNTDGVWDSTPDQVTVTAEPSDGFYVQLSWNSDSDQDLHLLRGGARLYDVPGDCSWCNMAPSWGAAGLLDDPSLDWDTIEGFGPETATIEEPSPDSYGIQVVYYGQDGDPYCFWSCPPTVATVTLYMDGVEVETWQRTLNEAGEVWDVATIDWPSQRITTVDRKTTTSLTGCN